MSTLKDYALRVIACLYIFCHTYNYSQLHYDT